MSESNPAVPFTPPTRIEQRRFAAAVVLALLFVLGGILWTWRIGQAGNRLYHELAHAREHLDALRGAAGPTRQVNAR